MACPRTLYFKYLNLVSQCDGCLAGEWDRKCQVCTLYSVQMRSYLSVKGTLHPALSSSKKPNGWNKSGVVFISWKGRMEIGGSGPAWRLHELPLCRPQNVSLVLMFPRWHLSPSQPVPISDGRREKAKGTVPLVSVAFKEYLKPCPVPSAYTSLPKL